MKIRLKGAVNNLNGDQWETRSIFFFNSIFKLCFRVGRTEREKETKAAETSTSSSILAGWLLSLEGVEGMQCLSPKLNTTSSAILHHKVHLE